MKIVFEKGPLNGKCMYTKAIGPDIDWHQDGVSYKYVYRMNGSKEPMGPNSVLHFECATHYDEPVIVESKSMSKEEKISRRMKEIWKARKDGMG